MLNGLFSEVGKRGFIASFHDGGDVWRDLQDPGFAPCPKIDAAAGLFTGTPVATEDGWRNVETIVPGDSVLTFDHGLLPVADVRIGTLKTAMSETPLVNWPLHVPAGVLDNRAPLQLLPCQQILIESDLAEELLGDAFVLMTARSLVGYRGITARQPTAQETLVTLAFEAEQLIHAAGSALLLCPGLPQLAQPGAHDPAALYSRLDPQREKQLAIWMKRGETCANLTRARFDPLPPDEMGGASVQYVN